RTTPTKKASGHEKFKNKKRSFPIRRKIIQRMVRHIRLCLKHRLPNAQLRKRTILLVRNRKANHPNKSNYHTTHKRTLQQPKIQKQPKKKRSIKQQLPNHAPTRTLQIYGLPQTNRTTNITTLRNRTRRPQSKSHTSTYRRRNKKPLHSSRKP